MHKTIKHNELNPALRICMQWVPLKISVVHIRLD